MIGCYDFCGHYEWTFAWLDEQTFLVHCADEAKMRSVMASSSAAAAAQRRRWELGRLQMARRLAPQLFLEAARKRADAGVATRLRLPAESGSRS